MVGGTSHRNRIIEISVLGQIVVLFENVFLDGASRGATQQLSSTAGFASPITFTRIGYQKFNTHTYTLVLLLRTGKKHGR